MITASLTLVVACDRPDHAADCQVELPPHEWSAQPERPPPPPSDATLAERVEKMTMASWIVPGRGHRWVPDTHVIETVDGGLRLHGVARSTRPGDGYRLQLAVLIGFDAALATITLWNGARTEKLDTVEASGLWRELDEPSVAFDVELPRGTVPQGRWADVQTVVEIAPTDRLDSTDADVRRWIARAGPKPPQPRTCVKPDTVAGGDARRRLTSAGIGKAQLVPVPTPDGWPGNERGRPARATQLRSSARLGAGEEIATRLLVGGRPVGNARFLRGGEKEQLFALGTAPVDGDGPAMLVTWSDPHGAFGGATNFRSSNVVWVRPP